MLNFLIISSKLKKEMNKESLDLTTLDQALIYKIDAYIEGLSGNSEEQLIHILHFAQQVYGYLPHNLQLHIARKIGLSGARVNGVVTFYSFFNEEPVGKYVTSVCMGTACFVKGADKILDRVLNLTQAPKNKMSDDKLFTVKDVRCIGACGLAPVITINEKVYGKLKVNEVDKIIRRCRGEQHVD